MSPVTTLILPGIDNSGPDHWQSLWQRENPSFQRIVQDEWHAPRCQDWVDRLNQTLKEMPGRTVLVAHSSACAMVAHWVRGAKRPELENIHGALLVGPSDPEGPHYPPEPTGFAPMPLVSFPFPSIVVASTDDPYVSLDRAGEFASAWESRFVVIPNAGHINTASGLGLWPRGFALLRELQGE